VRIGRRRRLDALALAAAVALAGAAGLAGALAASSERVTRLWAAAEVGGDGAARVVEVIDYDFGHNRRHGIFRDVPGLDPAGPVQVSVASAPDQVEVTATAAGARLRIGDPARTVGGRHRYRIGYRLAGVAPGGRLAWDAVGTAWPVGIGAAELHLAAPWRLEGVRCVQGAEESEKPCPVAQPEPGHLVATLDGLDAGQGATLYAAAGERLAAAPALPDPPAGVPADPGTGPLPPALAAALGALAGAAAAARLVRRAGRERVVPGGAAEAAFGPAGGDGPPVVRVDAARLAELATVEFVPPSGLTAAQGGVVLAEEVRPEHKVAWLLAAAADGYLDLEEDGGQVTLVRLPRRGTPTADLLDVAFEGRDRLTLGSYDEDFADAWRTLGRELAGWQAGSGLWDPAGDRRRTLARTGGLAAGIAGLALAAQGAVWAARSGPGWLALVVVGGMAAGAGAAAAVCAWELRVRTPAGSGLWLRTESFRRFLAASEARHAEEAARRGVLRQYTAWAVAVGELHHWSRAVAASSVAADAAARYPLLAPALLSGSSSATVAPSSAGSGGGSGGGVGGGAGGGGGGSW
jgi:hypothetical protein